MSSLIKHKRVEFTELFYDLVFVFAISKTAALIHHLHHGIVEWPDFIAFILTILILVNNWMVQTVFTNRYGKNSLFNIFIMYINMAILLFISNMIVNDWKGYFNYFAGAIALLSLTLFIQYLTEYLRKESSPEDRGVITGFLAMNAVRALSSFIAFCLGLNRGYPVFIIGMIGGTLVPVFFRNKQERVPINFPHLVERISLLVIITFGEMIMGIAGFFTPEVFNIRSVISFLVVINLFMYYFGEFDHALDEGKGTQGLFLIYSHYFVLMGLLMVTVSMTFITEESVNHIFSVLFLYMGVFLFQGAVILNGIIYNKAYLKFTKEYILFQILTGLAAFIISIIFANRLEYELYIVAIYTLIIEIHFIIFFITKSKKAGEFGWHWF